ncbi:hypothetical protein TNCV_3346421 [Trichonephila clavipes]|nr:hypothetical protein TNCV_3346421 [Trichonephila clavipes]
MNPGSVLQHEDGRIREKTKMGQDSIHHTSAFGRDKISTLSSLVMLTNLFNSHRILQSPHLATWRSSPNFVEVQSPNPLSSGTRAGAVPRISPRCLLAF